MYDEIIQTVKTLAASHTTLPITIGALPQDNGLAMYIAAGAPDTTYIDRGALITCDITLNGKHSDQQAVLSALSTIHAKLSQLKSYPSGTDWEITNIQSSTAPNFIEREDSTGQWLYGSVLEVTFFMKGV